MQTTTAAVLKVADMHYSRHHFFWPRHDYVTELQKKFRALPCSQARHTDALTHRAHHDAAFFLHPPAMPPAVEMAVAIERHRSLVCRCYNPLEAVRFNLLQLSEDHPLYGLSCLWADIDIATALRLQEHIGAPQELHPIWVESLWQRHQGGHCICAYFEAKASATMSRSQHSSNSVP